MTLPTAALLFLIPVSAPVQTPAPAPPPAIEYSDAYQMRAKVHKVGSFAMLPLAGAEYLLGKSVYDGNTGRKDAHVAVGIGISTLFAVNTVTGVWNLIESRNDPNGRTKRWVHAILMMGADAGFVATFAAAPERRGSADERNTHRTLALTSLAVGTAGYLLMLLSK